MAKVAYNLAGIKQGSISTTELISTLGQQTNVLENAIEEAANQFTDPIAWEYLNDLSEIKDDVAKILIELDAIEKYCIRMENFVYDLENS